MCLEKNTLVVVLSDNGGPTRELTSSNRPLRGEKGQLLEGGIRVPFVIRWEGQVPTGRIEDRPVSSLDLFATVVSVAGASPAAQLDGVNLLPHLADPDQTPIHPRLYWRVGPQAALREGDWKIHRGRGDTLWQLYNVANDLGETRDMAQMLPERLARLEAEWKRPDSEMIDPLWSFPARKRSIK